MERELNGYHFYEQSWEFLTLKVGKNSLPGECEKTVSNHEDKVGQVYGLGAAGNRKPSWLPYGCLLIKAPIEVTFLHLMLSLKNDYTIHLNLVTRTNCLALFIHIIKRMNTIAFAYLIALFFISSVNSLISSASQPGTSGSFFSV